MRLDGFHLMLQGRASVRGWSPDLIHLFLDEAVVVANMTLIAGPYVEQSAVGIGGIAILAESHVAVHGQHATHGFWIDLFSCRAFDDKAFAAFAAERLQLFNVTRQLLRRDAVE